MKMKEFIFEILKENKELRENNIELSKEYEAKSFKINDLVFENEELKRELKESKDKYACLESDTVIIEYDLKEEIEELKNKLKATRNEMLIYKNEFQKLKNNSQPKQPKKKK